MEVRVVLSVVPRPRREDRLLSLWRQMIISSNQIAVLSPGWRVSSVLVSFPHSLGTRLPVCHH